MEGVTSSVCQGGSSHEKITWGGNSVEIKGENNGNSYEELTKLKQIGSV